MTKYETASLAYKVSGIFVIMLFFMGFSSLGSVFAYRVENSAPIVWLFAFLSWSIPFVGLALLAWILLFRSTDLAGHSFTETSEPVNNSGISYRDAQTIAFSLVGVALVGFAIPSVVRILIIHFDVPSWERTVMNSGGFTTPELAQLIGSGVQLVLGIGLFCGAAPLSNFWHRLREPRLRRR